MVPQKSAVNFFFWITAAIPPDNLWDKMVSDTTYKSTDSPATQINHGSFTYRVWIEIHGSIVHV